MRERESPLLCFYCEEPILPRDESERLLTGHRLHMECMFRSVCGSVAHIQKRCRCFVPGSTEGDPPGMTPRQAARAACEANKTRAFAHILNCDGACPMCGCFDFFLGPRGGAARNIMCAGCGAKFFYSPPFEPGLIWNDESVYDTSQRVQLPKSPLPGEEGEPQCD